MHFTVHYYNALVKLGPMGFCKVIEDHFHYADFHLSFFVASVMGFYFLTTIYTFSEIRGERAEPHAYDILTKRSQILTFVSLGNTCWLI